MVRPDWSNSYTSITQEEYVRIIEKINNTNRATLYSGLEKLMPNLKTATTPEIRYFIESNELLNELMDEIRNNNYILDEEKHCKSDDFVYLLVDSLPIKVEKQGWAGPQSDFFGLLDEIE